MGMDGWLGWRRSWWNGPRCWRELEFIILVVVLVIALVVVFIVLVVIVVFIVVQ